MACPACDRIARALQPADPFFLASLRQSVAILHKHQPFPGWCTLWLKDHCEHTDQLPRSRQLELWEDVADLARAIRAVTGCRRLNYENLGNVVPHVHWHLIPRFEPPRDAEPTWAVFRHAPEFLDCGVPDDLRDELVQHLRAALQA